MDQTFFVLEIIGIIAFAISGAMKAVDKHSDIFGVILLGVVAALGGGVIRDVLLGNTPPMMFVNYEYLLVAVATSIGVFTFVYINNRQYYSKVALIEQVNNIFDAIGLGVFTISGMNTAISCGYVDNAFFVIFLGMTTGIGGGMLRDVLVKEMPFVLTRRIYAVASLIGGSCYYVLHTMGYHYSAIFIGIGMIFIIRLLATIFRWNLPRIR